jgi:DNA/RNA-binding domain of Phe-tRNA-synthetase-like protein
MRRAKSGERFHGIGMGSADSLVGVEVVIEDVGTRRLVAVYPYRDSDDSKIAVETTEVLFMMCGVPGIDDAVLERTARLTEEYVGRFCTSPW